MCSRNYKKRIYCFPRVEGGGGARVCQVNVTRITRKVLEILNFIFRTLSFFSGRHTVSFVRTWNRAQNWGRQTESLVEKLVTKLTTAAHDLVENHRDEATGFFQPCCLSSSSHFSLFKPVPKKSGFPIHALKTNQKCSIL